MRPTNPLGLRGFSDRQCGVLRDPHHHRQCRPLGRVAPQVVFDAEGITFLTLRARNAKLTATLEALVRIT